MKRLTYNNPDGTFRIARYDVTKFAAELYKCICTLEDYEDTGLSPAEVKDLQAEHEAAKELIEKLKSNYK